MKYVTLQEHTVKCTVQLSTQNTAQGQFPKVFCQFFSRFKRACCVEWLFLNPHSFGDKIFTENFSICSKRTLLYYEIIGNQLICWWFALLFGSSFWNTDINYFQPVWERFYRNAFINTVCDRYHICDNLIMAGDISPLELFLDLISFLYLKTMSVKTNSNLKLKEFLNLSLIILI